MANSYEITGKIKQIGIAQSFGSRGFTKREFILTVEDGKYAQDIALELQGDKCDVIDAFSVGQECAASFNLRGREYNSKFYNTLVAWKIVKTGNESAQTPQTQQDEHQTAASANLPDSFDDEEDSIPF